jgi:hypothetical protein
VRSGHNQWNYYFYFELQKNLRNVSGRGPAILLKARPFCRLKAPLGLSLLRKRGFFWSSFSRGGGRNWQMLLPGTTFL